ncbi:NTP transferase domain-containing protein [Alphaproteobacteria bacterium]|nr:NTP transferase domain-containing protein [Alphaproteobacteria bacterium]
MQTFGSFLKKAREQVALGQREFARQLQISAAYLNDIEKQKRPAPSIQILHLMKDILQIEDSDIFFELAGKSKKKLPPDLEMLLLTQPELLSLTRTIKNLNISTKQVIQIEAEIMSQNCSAIIIAAGLGSRLQNLTKDIPKCMLKLGGKSILEHQLDAYSANNIKNVSVVRGYKSHKINVPTVTYYDNDEYQSNNVLNSLLCAEEALAGNVIVSYSDIIFSAAIVERLLDSSADISIVVDVDWRGRYLNRKDHPLEEAENAIFDANHELVDIGKIATSPRDVHGEFIGMMKFSPRGAEIFKRHFHRAKKLFWNKPFQRAKTFQNSYITDILKDMIDFGVPIHTVIIERGWQEIDTVEDYENAKKYLEEWSY